MLTRPAILLRAEEAVILTITIFAYQHLHYSWLLFAILFLTPDLFMLGYLANPRIGAAQTSCTSFRLTCTLPVLNRLLAVLQLLLM